MNLDDRPILFDWQLSTLKQSLGQNCSERPLLTQSGLLADRDQNKMNPAYLGNR